MIIMRRLRALFTRLRSTLTTTRKIPESVSPLFVARSRFDQLYRELSDFYTAEDEWPSDASALAFDELRQLLAAQVLKADQGRQDRGHLLVAKLELSHAEEDVEQGHWSLATLAILRAASSLKQVQGIRTKDIERRLARLYWPIIWIHQIDSPPGFTPLFPLSLVSNVEDMKFMHNLVARALPASST